MPRHFDNEPMVELFIFETNKLIEQLEQAVLDTEKSGCYTQMAVNEIFRVMHTIKGSASMMLFENIAFLTHSLEDLFYFLRENATQKLDCARLSDLVLEGVDFIKMELVKINNGDNPDADPGKLVTEIEAFLELLKKASPQKNKPEAREQAANNQCYYISQSKKTVLLPEENLFKARIFFEAGCEMENVRAYAILHELAELAEILQHTPQDILDNDASAAVIQRDGFEMLLKSNLAYQDLAQILSQTLFLRSYELSEIEQQYIKELPKEKIILEEPLAKKPAFKEDYEAVCQQTMISVHVEKLDKLMDLVGELVISEAMVTQNPDLKGLELENFQKAARQLQKITGELQDMVMSVRMVPIAATFHKMNRIVRDMSKKLAKKVKLEILGQETEVDKNIIEHISDPLMHLVRNALDHGIESLAEREEQGKPSTAILTLEAKNAGSDVLVLVRDDGKGLNKTKIVQKARENGLLQQNANELTDQEIYALIFKPGFSTKENVSEYSGRGVGMDVVASNLEAVGGTVSVDSVPDIGTTITLKIPLTLAIIDGMNIRVGNSRFTVPTICIKESFRPQRTDIIADPDGHEMIMVRGQCYPILRLHQRYNIHTEVDNFDEGIMLMVEEGAKGLCIFADELLGEQQVVVKSLPNYIKRFWKIKGLAGCTLLGDGCISLILDMGALIKE